MKPSLEAGHRLEGKPRGCAVNRTTRAHRGLPARRGPQPRCPRGLNTMHGVIVKEPRAAGLTLVVLESLDRQTVAEAAGFYRTSHLDLTALRTGD